MSTQSTDLSDDDSHSSLLESLDEICDRFEQAWCRGEKPHIEDAIRFPQTGGLAAGWPPSVQIRHHARHR